MNTTTQPETAFVTVEKFRGLGNQQPSLAQAWKVQRPERKLVGSKRSRSAGHLFAGDDVVRTALKGAELSRKRAQRNITAAIPATNMGFDVKETLEGQEGPLN